MLYCKNLHCFCQFHPSICFYTQCQCFISKSLDSILGVILAGNFNKVVFYSILSIRKSPVADLLYGKYYYTLFFLYPLSKLAAVAMHLHYYRLPSLGMPNTTFCLYVLALFCVIFQDSSMVQSAGIKPNTNHESDSTISIQLIMGFQ
jgi:hypothetical protein